MAQRLSPRCLGALCVSAVDKPLAVLTLFLLDVC
jgi:hypothetical protein